MDGSEVQEDFEASMDVDLDNVAANQSAFNSDDDVSEVRLASRSLLSAQQSDTMYVDTPSQPPVLPVATSSPPHSSPITHPSPTISSNINPDSHPTLPPVRQIFLDTVSPIDPLMITLNAPPADVQAAELSSCAESSTPLRVPKQTPSKVHFAPDVKTNDAPTRKRHSSAPSKGRAAKRSSSTPKSPRRPVSLTKQQLDVLLTPGFQ